MIVRKSLKCWLGQQIEIAHSIKSGEDLFSPKILHRETKFVKFNGTLVITSKFTNKNKIFNNLWCNNNVF